MYKVIVLVLAVVSGTLSAVTTSQRYGNVIRPCHPVDNLKCIRDNLEANSQCSTEGLGSLPASYSIGEVRFETPFFNSSQVDHNLVIQNHNNCTVSEFYFNLQKDTAVLSLDCRGLIFSSTRDLIQHESYKEDVIYSYNSSWEYPLIRLTANIPKANAIDICNAFVFADVAVMPKFLIKPNNKPTADFLSYDLSLVPIFERETFLYRAPQLFRTYVSSRICNFGCFA